ncbi:hypothetical protein DH2020_019197 [Rehmannia glutinosa]|uniref:NB-ARC domain-containing protein n=1 Tax=Rehmannia glutinosa TaxID=99300 RepID=A0ABR0WQ53_REHGL
MERQIRDVVYDAEDTIDNCLSTTKGNSFWRRGLNPKRVSLAKEVRFLTEDKIKPMFDKAKMDFANMQIGDGSSTTTLQEPFTKVKKVQLDRQENVIGFEDEENKIITYLKEQKEELDVISIIGMPGLGKTTLASNIFRNPIIEYEFPTRIWVCISSDFRRKNVFLDILSKLTKLTDNMSSMTEEDLANTIRSHLEKKKFLIVMDDVWSAEHWDDLQVALPRRNRSKILITNRQANLVRRPNSRNHHLRFLNPEDCWKLLQFKVFGEALCPPELEDVGKSIARAGKSLEEVAMDYLEELINRNLVMVDEVRPDGKVKTCRVHDMLREFCQIKAGKNENLFQEVRKSWEGIFEPPISKHRRICLHSNVLDFFSSNLLLHLYIVLSSDFKVLPEAVSKLRNTQTLIIDTTSRTLKIKADIWKMIQLRHVKTNASIILLKSPENNQGKNLQTLANISPESCTKDVFDQACYLKKLGVRGRLTILLADNNGKFDSFGKLSSLENLKLLNDVHPNPPSEGQLPCLPPSNKFPPKLRSLTLSATFLNWEQMSVLGNLRNLEVLKLKDNAFVGECWEVEDDGFRLLRLLLIEYTNLVYWIASDHHFPNLRCLFLRNCEELEELPEELANVQSLRVIELHRTSKTATASARKIQDENLSSGGLKVYVFPPDE